MKVENDLELHGLGGEALSCLGNSTICTEAVTVLCMMDIK